MKIYRANKQVWSVAHSKIEQIEQHYIEYMGYTFYGDNFKECWQNFILGAVHHKLIKITK